MAQLKQTNTVVTTQTVGANAIAIFEKKFAECKKFAEKKKLKLPKKGELMTELIIKGAAAISAESYFES